MDAILETITVIVALVVIFGGIGALCFALIMLPGIALGEIDKLFDDDDEENDKT